MCGIFRVDRAVRHAREKRAVGLEEEGGHVSDEEHDRKRHAEIVSLGKPEECGIGQIPAREVLERLEKTRCDDKRERAGESGPGEALLAEGGSSPPVIMALTMAMLARMSPFFGTMSKSPSSAWMKRWKKQKNVKTAPAR